MSASLRKRPKCCVAAKRRYVPILLKKSLMVCRNGDFLALVRFAAEAGDDGAAEGEPRAIFYSFCLDDVLPDDHCVREIAAVLDLSWVHTELAPYHSPFGRPSIDPVLMIRMLIVGYGRAIFG